MALAAATVWEVRSTGSDSNGGGFVTGASGTDYSQQDSAQYALTGIATSGAGAVFLTASAAANMVGNILQVISGTNFTVGTYQVLSVSVGVSVTVDRSICTGVGASGVINIGGSLTSPGVAAGLMVSGNIVWVKVGTYPVNLTLTVNTAGGRVQLPSSGNGTILQMIGYNSTRGDFGSPPIFQISTGSASVYACNSADNHAQFVNIKVDGQSGANTNGFSATASSGKGIFCQAINCTGFGFGNGNTSYYLSCYAANCGTGFNPGSECTQCVAVSCTTGFTIPDAADSHCLSECLAYACGTGFSLGGALVTSQCTAHSCTSHGFNFIRGSRAPVVNNCIAWNNGGYGFAGTDATQFFVAPAVGSNTSGNYQTTPRTFSPKTLTVDPLTNVSGSDFTPNSTTGGGALIRAASLPTPLSGTSTTNYRDIGAVQHADSGAGGLLLNSGMQGGLRG